MPTAECRPFTKHVHHLSMKGRHWCAYVLGVLWLHGCLYTETIDLSNIISGMPRSDQILKRCYSKRILSNLLCKKLLIKSSFVGRYTISPETEQKAAIGWAFTLQSVCSDSFDCWLIYYITHNWFKYCNFLTNLQGGKNYWVVCSKIKDNIICL